MKIHKELEQGTQEWLDVRKGKITASVVKQLLTSKFAISKGQAIKLLAYDLAAERITGRLTPFFETYDMKRGHIEEVSARNLYAQHFAPVEEIGFIENGILGYSPDGLVGTDGIIEIKSRQQKYQVKTFAEDAIPDEYMVQCQTGLMVSEREWCDFIQYSNGMPLFVKRTGRNEELIATIKEATKAFEQEIVEIVDTFTVKAAKSPVAEYVEDVFKKDTGESVDLSGMTEDEVAAYILSKID